MHDIAASLTPADSVVTLHRLLSLGLERSDGGEFSFEVLKPEQYFADIDIHISLPEHVIRNAINDCATPARDLALQRLAERKVVRLQFRQTLFDQLLFVNRHPYPRGVPMSVSTQSATNQATFHDQLEHLFEVAVALDHQLIDLRFALEKASESESLAIVHGQLLAAQAILNQACASFSDCPDQGERNHG